MNHKSVDFEQLTPMMQHYIQTKDANPDCILFYRLGDFYEMFFEDAEIVSKELEKVVGLRNVLPCVACHITQQRPI